MSWAVALLGACGLLLAVSGIPPLRRRTLALRVDPYVSGLHGRPSRLLARVPTSRSRLERVVVSGLGRVGIRPDESVALRMAAAGLEPNPASLRLDQVVWALTATVGSWSLVALAATAGIAVDLRVLPVLSLIALVGGWLFRDWWLGRQIEARRASLQEELPTAIDLITLSIMAGEAVPAAFGRVAEALAGDVGREFDRVVADMRAGEPVAVALEEFKLRIPIPAVARLVDALVTAIERGTPLADVLRAQADDGREARRRQLIEMGGRREVMMLVPVVFLIMPVVVVFALLPGLISLDLLVP